MVTCKNCGGSHPTWECKKPAKIAAKAASTQKAPRALRGEHTASSPMPAAGSRSRRVGTEAGSKISVRGDGVEGKGHAGAASEHSKAEAPKALLPSGRVENTPDGPAVTVAEKFNKTAYMREYMRKRRAAAKGKT